MKLFTFCEEKEVKLGVNIDEHFIHVELAKEICNEKNVKTDVMEVVNGGEQAIDVLEAFVDSLDKTNARYLLDEASIKWGPAVTNPQKIICVGLNYRKHADETNSPYPDVPILFNKFSNALTSHLAEITVPHTTERLDYEVELGIIIGKTGKYIKEKDALDYVFGYATGNDLSARDIQKRVSQWLTGKTNDGFAPLGPYLVPKSEIADPNNLTLTTMLNGEIRQNSTTADMIFSCEQLISYISTYVTLEPGDVILTGTPEGVILGLPKEERVFIQPGDKVTVEVEKLGALTNTFVAENL